MRLKEGLRQMKSEQRINDMMKNIIELKFAKVIDEDTSIILINILSWVLNDDEDGKGNK